jgi:uncharacterized spore protein YtfJ
MKYPIPNLFRPRSKISERIAGEPLEIGGQTIRPVVRVSGQRSVGGDASSGGAVVRVQPEAVIILERDGREHHVPIREGTHLMLWALAGVALIVAVASLVVARVLQRESGISSNHNLREVVE